MELSPVVGVLGYRNCFSLYGSASEMDLEPVHDLRAQRQAKLSQIREMGVDPYPYRFEPTYSTSDIKDQFETLEASEETISVAGRLMAIRGHGKTSFAHIQDRYGRIQIYVRKDDVGEEAFKLFKCLDIGDHAGVTGKAFRTRTGEMTVQVQYFKVLSKSLRPLPIPKEKTENGKRIVYDEFSDKELRYRQRYVDLVVNPQVRETFETRAKIISAIRSFLDSKGFLEVETPILQPLYGGASARPFITHHNALDMPLYLRIADELYLKRLIVGGLERVYEFCKNFRNEGMDRTHSPEFTLLELYQAYADYDDMMQLTENMICFAAEQVIGSTKITYQETEIDLSPPWKRITMLDSIEQYAGVRLDGISEDGLRTICKDLNVQVDEHIGKGKMIDEIFKEYVEGQLIQPTFVIDYPVETSPLAKRHRDNPDLAERFEPFIHGGEIGNAFTELNDPIDQRERFEHQRRLIDRGDDEAQPLDEDFLRSLEYGMPPTGGLGIGIDRLVMLLTDAASIRDVLLFPLMRPESKN